MAAHEGFSLDAYEGFSFTPEVQQVVRLAEEEARRLSPGFLGPEHILLGLLAEGESKAARALADLHVTLDGTRRAVVFIFGYDAADVTVPYGDQELVAKVFRRLVGLVVEEASALNQRALGPEHLLLGLLRLDMGWINGPLSLQGVEAPQVRAQLLRLLTRTEG